jgi:hypothetical protein
VRAGRFARRIGRLLLASSLADGKRRFLAISHRRRSFNVRLPAHRVTSTLRINLDGLRINLDGISAAAFNGDVLSTTGDARFDGAEVTGELRLPGAQIGLLGLSAATLTSNGDRAPYGASLSTTGDAYSVGWR